MRLLLDTKVLLWVLMDYSSLGIDARLKMKQADMIYVSAVSVLEARVAEAAGELELPADFLETIGGSGLVVLPMRWEGADELNDSDWSVGDMFDRLLLIQAREEQLRLVTADAVLLKAYPDLCLDGRT